MFGVVCRTRAVCRLGQNCCVRGFFASGGVSVYYGNYAKYLAKLSTNIVTEKLAFAQTEDSVVKYGMRFSTFKFVADNGNTLLLYALDTDNFVPQADEVYAVMHSGDFIADICEVTDDE